MNKTNASAIVDQENAGRLEELSRDRTIERTDRNDQDKSLVAVAVIDYTLILRC